MKDLFDNKFREIISFEMVCIAGGLVSGTLLALYMDNLLLLPGILILLPGFLEMRGNISGSMGARITSGLFLGIVRSEKIETKIVKGNVTASFILALVVSLVLGFLAFAFNWLVFGILTPEIIIIPIVASIISTAIEVPVTILSTFYLFRRGHDPNDIIGPVVTTTGDITSIVSLLIAMVVV